MSSKCQIGWLMFAIPVLDQLRQEDYYNFQASQGQRVRPYLKTLITKLNTKTKMFKILYMNLTFPKKIQNKNRTVSLPGGDTV